MPGRASLSGKARTSRPDPSRQEKTMITQLSHPGTPPCTAARKAGPRLGRLASVLAAAICGLLASAAVIPAAFARVVPPPGGQYGPGPIRPVPGTTVRVITTGGTAGWQIALIALGAALAAAAAVLVDRARTARRAVPPTAA
jgi:hypothetical protein